MTAIINKRLFDKLDHIGNILSSGKSDYTYQEISDSLNSDVNKHSHSYLVLIVEAVVSGVSVDQIKQDHPEAIRRAQAYITSVETYMPGYIKQIHAIMKEKLPLKSADSI